jgi:hypothetical protein
MTAADNQPQPNARDPDAEGVGLTDFYAYMPMHNYIFVPARQPWPAQSVNARVGPIRERIDKDGKPKYIAANTWLDRNRPVEQMTWAPGLPLLINNRLVVEGGWFPRDGVNCFNLYKPPPPARGNPENAERWLDHVREIYPEDADTIINWLAHRVQRPDEKVNHALVLGGNQGIGKDTLLEPVKRAIGTWNWADISPRDVMGNNNGFARSVIIRVNEARDLGDLSRYDFYDHLKLYCASPPDVLRVNEKYLREYYVINCCGVIITTNHKTDGMYLPADDRRHYVAWSSLTKEDFEPAYWDQIWRWYDDGGAKDVAAFLATLDISPFNAKAPPPKTPSFWDIVNANRAPEDAEIADILDLLSNPDALTLAHLVGKASTDFADWLQDHKNRRVIPHRLEACGYVPVRNDGAKDQLWKIGKRRQAVYAKATLSLHDQIVAAQHLAGQ